jgi:hypothetical protein
MDDLEARDFSLFLAPDFLLEKDGGGVVCKGYR